MNQERVNHPQHYQSSSGIECIDIIRHYTCDIANAIKYLWRAGQKQEEGMTDAEKETEDLKKALWYIDDYTSGPQMSEAMEFGETTLDHKVLVTTGHTCSEIAQENETVYWALRQLLRVGLIHDGHVLSVEEPESSLGVAKTCIQHRIDTIAKGGRKEADE